MPSTAGTREVAPAGACSKSASKLDALHTLRALWSQRTSRQRMECVQLAGAFRTAREPLKQRASAAFAKEICAKVTDFYLSVLNAPLVAKVNCVFSTARLDIYIQ